MKKGLSRASVPIWTAVIVCLAPWTIALGEDSAQRIEDLETSVKELTTEIESLKGQIQERKELAPPSGQQKASHAPGVSWRDGVSINDANGNWSLRIFGRGQLDYRHFDPGAAADTFAIRRARLGAAMSFLKDYAFNIEGEYATGSGSGAATQTSSLTNAYMDFNWFSNARIRAGQFKPQFGLELTASGNFSDFQERALTQNLIQNLNFDRGVMVHGAPVKWLNYGVTISNGTGLNLDERQLAPQDLEADGKTFTGRLTANFAQIMRLPDSVIHVGASYKTGKAANSQANPYSAAAGLTESRGVTFFNPEAFASASVAGSTIDRTLSAAELALAFKSWKLQGEYWQARYEGSRATAPATGFDRTIEAGYLSVLWLVTGEHYADSYNSGIFGRISPRNSFSLNPDGGWGAWEAGVRYSLFDASDFLAAGAGVANTGRVSTAGTGATASDPAREAKAWTLGLKWIPHSHARLILNYIVTRFDSTISANGMTMDDERSITLRAQIDF